MTSLIAGLLMIATSASSTNQVMAQDQGQPIKFSIKNISIKPTSNTSADVQVAFSAYNPTKGTVMIEEIQYDVSLDGTRITSGSIGERLEGFLASSATIYPIVSGSEVVLKDKQVAHKSNINQDVWNKIMGGINKNSKSKYLITGTIAYKQGSVLEKNGGENSFRLTYP
jgi:LEA14-like dessication related protein